MPYLSLANAQFRAGQYSKAIESFEIARSRGLIPIRFYLTAARSNAALGDLHRALEIYAYMLTRQALEEKWRTIVLADVRDTVNRLNEPGRQEMP